MLDLEWHRGFFSILFWSRPCSFNSENRDRSVTASSRITFFGKRSLAHSLRAHRSRQLASLTTIGIKVTSYLINYTCGRPSTESLGGIVELPGSRCFQRLVEPGTWIHRIERRFPLRSHLLAPKRESLNSSISLRQHVDYLQSSTGKASRAALTCFRSLALRVCPGDNRQRLLQPDHSGDCRLIFC